MRATPGHWVRTARPMSSLLIVGLVAYAFVSTVIVQTNLLIRTDRPYDANSLPNLHVSNSASAEGKPDAQARKPAQDVIPCKYDPASTIRPFGTFDALPVNACALALETMDLPAHLSYDDLGYRLPFYDSHAIWIYRCRMVSQATEDVLKTKAAVFDVDDLEDAQRNCTLTGQPAAMIEYLMAKGGTGSFSAARELIGSWIESSEQGKLALSAIHRILPLIDVRTNRDFYLLAQEKDWSSRLPSEAGQSVFPDVNTHKVIVPPRRVRTLLVRNARVEKNGRVASENMEVFYPKRAPYSHIALMENFVDPKFTRFVPNERSRQQMEAILRADHPQRAKCLSQVILSEDKVSCAFSDVAVAKVLVTSQNLGSQMFHYMCENLPRLGAYLDILKQDPSIHVHVACPEKHGYCIPLLELLGIKRERIVRGPALVLAKTALVPEGGRRHWPLGNLWGLRALRHAVLSQSFKDEKRYSVVESREVRVLVIKRAMTRLSGVTSSWYDRILRDLSLDPTFIFSFPSVRMVIKLFDDKDKTVMGDAYLQIKALRDADVVIGAHGAALSWITFARERTHFISFRSRSNSDIYEHLSLMFGVGFHHVLFRSTYEPLYKELRFTLANAVSELIDKDAIKEPLFVSVACIKCDTNKASLMARYFDLVVLFDVVLPEDHEPLPQNVILAPKPLPKPFPGDERTCFGYLYENLIDLAHEYLKGKRRKLYFGWVQNEDVMISPSFKRLWVTIEQFDGVFIADSIHAEQPIAAFFHESLRHPLCFDKTTNVKSLADSIGLASTALIVAPNRATASIASGRLFRTLKKAEQARWSALAKSITDHGEYSLVGETAGRDVRATEYFIAIKVKSASASEWMYRSPPSIVFLRERPSARTLGDFGDVRMIEMPFASFTKLNCNLPASALEEDSFQLEEC